MFGSARKGRRRRVAEAVVCGEARGAPGLRPVLGYGWANRRRERRACGDTLRHATQGRVLAQRLADASGRGEGRGVRVCAVVHVHRLRRDRRGRRGVLAATVRRDEARTTTRVSSGQRHCGRCRVTIMHVRELDLGRREQAEMQQQHQRGATSKQRMLCAHVSCECTRGGPDEPPPPRQPGSRRAPAQDPGRRLPVRGERMIIRSCVPDRKDDPPRPGGAPPALPGFPSAHSVTRGVWTSRRSAAPGAA